MARTIKEIEEEMEEIQMLMKIWNKFYRILTKTFYDENVDVKQLDPEFQQIKQIVAEHHANFMKVIKKDFHIGQSIMTTVKRTISLEGFHHLSPLEMNKTLIEWHDANILLNETLGTLECQRDKILRHREEKIPTGSAADRAKEFFTSDMFKLIVKILVAAAVIAVIVLFWEDIRSSAIYQDYLAWMIDPVLEMVGLATEEAAEEGAENGAGNGSQ